MVDNVPKNRRDVDDNSPDGTAEVARNWLGSILLGVLVRKKGLASAILHGFMNASGDVLGRYFKIS
jgi:glycosyltransferase involved in cell wall biosynthesis